MLGIQLIIPRQAGQVVHVSMGSLGKNYTELEGAASSSNNTSANSSPYSQGTLERQGLLHGEVRGSDARRQLDQESLLPKQGDDRSKGRSKSSASVFPLKGTRTRAGAGKGMVWWVCCCCARMGSVSGSVQVTQHTGTGISVISCPGP